MNEIESMHRLAQRSGLVAGRARRGGRRPDGRRVRRQQQRAADHAAERHGDRRRGQAASGYPQQGYPPGYPAQPGTRSSSRPATRRRAGRLPAQPAGYPQQPRPATRRQQARSPGYPRSPRRRRAGPPPHARSRRPTRTALQGILQGLQGALGGQMVNPGRRLTAGPHRRGPEGSGAARRAGHAARRRRAEADPHRGPARGDDGHAAGRQVLHGRRLLAARAP